MRDLGHRFLYPGSQQQSNGSANNGNASAELTGQGGLPSGAPPGHSEPSAQVASLSPLPPASAASDSQLAVVAGSTAGGQLAAAAAAALPDGWERRQDASGRVSSCYALRRRFTNLCILVSTVLLCEPQEQDDAMGRPAFPRSAREFPRLSFSVLLS